MATSAVFQLLVNEGPQDKLLMATQMLNKRLAEIERLRCKNPLYRDSTPTLADIERTHVLYINSHFKPFVAIAYEYNRIGANEGAAAFGKEITYSILQFGDFFGDMMVHIRLENLTGLGGQQVRYCDWLGHRLIQRVRFEVNGNFLDQYDSEAYNLHYNFRVMPNKEIAWRRCVGMEVPEPAVLYHNNGIDNYREIKMIASGAQTPKTSHTLVDLHVPLLFWFNSDPRLAIPSVSIPYGMRFIKVLFANLNNIAQSYPNINAPFIAPQITISDLYTNNFFVNPEIHDIFIRRIGFNLIRVYRNQYFQVNTNSAGLRLDQLKYPVESIFFGIIPDENLDTLHKMNDWHKHYQVVNVPVPMTIVTPNPAPPPNYQIEIGFAEWKQGLRVITDAYMTTRGINIYDKYPVGFFHNYLTYKYGFDTLQCPYDMGLNSMMFNLYPGSFQPSGHFNMSRAREVFLYYFSDQISPSYTGVMTVYAITINFLLIAEATAVLRYNT